MNPEIVRVFNQGSDARIAGILYLDNPYQEDNHLHRWWKKGWLDAHWHWGDEAKWPHLSLPEVQDP